MPTGTLPLTGPGIVQSVLRFSQGDGEIAENVLGFANADGHAATAVELETLNGKIQAWYENGDGSHSYQSLQSASCTLLSITSRDLTSLTGEEVVTDVGDVGSASGTELANGLTFTVTARTGHAGRSHRGRVYLVGLTTGFLSSDINVADAAKAQNAVDAFNGMITGPHNIAGDYACNILSRSNSGAYRSAIAFFVVTAFGYYDLFMDYQRRRAPGHNRHH